MSNYPKTLVHPSYRRADIRNSNVLDHDPAPYTPDRYPPVTVKNEADEMRHRALGYLAFGETPPAMIDYREYPLMMVHPDHVPEIPEHIDAHREVDVNGQPHGPIIISKTPAVRAKFPAVQVENAAQEEEWTSKGYHRPGVASPNAAQAAKASPHNPSHVHNEWPKMVDGQIRHDPSSPGSFKKYPMMIGDVVVNSEDEEAEERNRQGKPAPSVTARGGDQSDQIAALQKQVADLTALLTGTKKNKGGRPKGSKNKPSAVMPSSEAAD